MDKAAIIFDVDGVLLHLTKPEEHLFFEPFRKYQRPDLISYDWNSYRIRNEEDILGELVERHSLPPAKISEFKSEYLNLVRERNLASIQIQGAKELLRSCATFATLGIATANFRSAAQMRLERVNLWQYVDQFAFGADGGGAKHEILGRVLQSIGTPKSRVIYIGDNLNDLEAGLINQVHFIGFSENDQQLKFLSQNGAKLISQNHGTTQRLIKEILAA